MSGGYRSCVPGSADPKLLLLDEPLGALDVKLRTQVQIELKAIQRRTGKTFFVTHDQEEALTMSDRIVVMNAGRVEQDGTPEELYHRPKSRFVAEFIGETNLIEGVVSGRSGEEIVIDWRGAGIRATSAGNAVDEGTTVAAALRPESIECSAERPAGDHALEGRIVNRLFKGSRTVVDIKVQGNDEDVLKAYLRPEIVQDVVDEKVWGKLAEPSRFGAVRMMPAAIDRLP